jgi:hypothetical protein
MSGQPTPTMDRARSTLERYREVHGDYPAALNVSYDEFAALEWESKHMPSVKDVTVRGPMRIMGVTVMKWPATSRECWL